MIVDQHFIFKLVFETPIALLIQHIGGKTSVLMFNVHLKSENIADQVSDSSTS